MVLRSSCWVNFIAENDQERRKKEREKKEEKRETGTAAIFCLRTTALFFPPFYTSISTTAKARPISLHGTRHRARYFGPFPSLSSTTQKQLTFLTICYFSQALQGKKREKRNGRQKKLPQHHRELGSPYSSWSVIPTRVGKGCTDAPTSIPS